MRYLEVIFSTRRVAWLRLRSGTACIAVAWLAILLATPLAASAQGREVLDLDTSRQPVALRDWGDWWMDPAGTAGVQEVSSALASQFRPMAEQQILPLGPGQALWIRFTVPAAPDTERWYLRLPNAGLDRVTLHTRQPDGRWSMQTAGDRVPVSQWPLPHIHPLFGLRVSAEEPTYHLLRVEASNSFSTPILFESESHLGVSHQRVSLAHGVYFGLIAMVTIFAVFSAAVLRDLAYVHFALFAAVLTLAVASTTGVAGLHLWNDSPTWNDSAEYVLPLATFAPLLLFLAQAVSLRARSPRLFGLVAAAAAVSVGLAATVTLMPSPQRMQAVLVTCMALTTLGLAMLAWAWWHGDRFASWLLLAFVPLLVTLPFPAARSLGWLKVGLLSQHAWQAGVALSLAPLFLLLMLRSQERRDNRNRVTQLDHTDPLTGLSNERVFMQRLQGLIDRSRRFGHSGAVMLVDLTNQDSMRSEFGRRTAIELLVRLAGRLGMIARDVDTIARLGDTRFGMLVEGPVPPERLGGFASKVLARLIMPFGGMPVGAVARPKLALVLVPGHADSPDAVVQRLEALLLQAQPDNRRSIFIAESDWDRRVSESNPASGA